MKNKPKEWMACVGIVLFVWMFTAGYIASIHADWTATDFRSRFLQWVVILLVAAVYVYLVTAYGDKWRRGTEP